jgi:hypothetical protein
LLLGGFGSLLAATAKHDFQVLLEGRLAEIDPPADPLVASLSARWSSVG